jgi:hypothetical protein
MVSSFQSKGGVVIPVSSIDALPDKTGTYSQPLRTATAPDSTETGTGQQPEIVLRNSNSTITVDIVVRLSPLLIFREVGRLMQRRRWEVSVVHYLRSRFLSEAGISGRCPSWNKSKVNSDLGKSSLLFFRSQTHRTTLIFLASAEHTPKQAPKCPTSNPTTTLTLT